MPIPESITVRRDSVSHYVECGDRSESGLTPDEALHCVAMFLQGQFHHYLKTAEQHAAWAAKLGRQDDGAARLIGQLGAGSKQ